MKKWESSQADRQGNYDLLRIICTLAVVSAHVSATYKTAITSDAFFGVHYTTYIPVILLYNTLSRFTVPCFMMLSGAFLLSNDKNLNYKFFYRKAIKNIGIPTIIFSVCYFLFSEIIGIVFLGGDVTALLSPVKNWIIGMPYYHMWYMYTLLGVYILIPVVLRVKNDIGEKRFTAVTWIFLFVSVIGAWTSSFEINWSPSKVIAYIPYAMAGYELRKLTLRKQSNIKGIICIFSGFLVEFVLTYIQYTHTMRGLAEADERYSVVGDFNPLVVIAAILIFLGFSQMRINGKIFENLARNTFIIYLFHAGVLSFMNRIIEHLGADADCRIVIPMIILATFGIAYVLTIIYNKWWGVIDKEDRIETWLYKLLHII